MNEQIGMFAEPEKTNKDTSLIEEMKGLIETLNEASLAYYQEAREIMLQKRSMQEYYSAEATLRRAMVRLRVSKDQSIN